MEVGKGEVGNGEGRRSAVLGNCFHFGQVEQVGPVGPAMGHGGHGLASVQALGIGSGIWTVLRSLRMINLV